MPRARQIDQLRFLSVTVLSRLTRASRCVMDVDLISLGPVYDTTRRTRGWSVKAATVRTERVACGFLETALAVEPVDECETIGIACDVFD